MMIVLNSAAFLSAGEYR